MSSVIEKFQEGLMFFNEGQLNEALAIFTSLVNEEFEDKLFKIMAYKSIANIYTLKNDYERAIIYSKLAFEYYEDEGNIDEKVNSILSIGNLYADKGDIEKTIEYYTDALKVYEQNKDTDPIEKAVTLLDLAVICLEKANNLQLAKNYFDQSLALYDKHASISVKAKTLIDIGTFFLDKGYLSNTLAYFEDAITIYDSVPMQKGGVLLDLGKALISHNEYDRGLEYFERGFKLFENISPDAFAEQIVSVGLFLESIRELDYSIEFLKRALEIYNKIESTKGIVNVLINLGEIYSKMGQIEHSITYYEEALKNFVEYDESEKATILMGLGNVLSNRGKIDKALEFFDQSLQIFTKIGDANNKAKVLQLMGKTFNRKNELDKAISYYEQSYTIFNEDEFNISRERATCINELGSIHLKLKNYTKAYEYFTDALKILDKSQDSLSKAEPLVYIGLIHYQKKDLNKANEFFSKGFELLASRQDPFDILNMFEEFYQIDENLAFEHAIKSPFGLLWVFTKYNELIESNQPISAHLWVILKKATQNWWNEIFENRETIFNNLYGDKKITRHRFRERDDHTSGQTDQPVSQFENNWLLKQLIKATQEPLTNDSIVNMLVGSNDLLTPEDEDLSILRDVQADLEPDWFVELPLHLRHSDSYLKIRLNNRIKRFGRLIGYPLLNKSGGSIRTIRIFFETQWLQRYVIDHIFVPNSQYEYESYEINPANTWLTDVYIMDLGENAQKFSQIELTYRIELELETKDEQGNNISFKTTNKRLIIPIYRKNNFENVQKFMANNNAALAIFIALFAVFFDFFDLLANFWDFPSIFTSWFEHPSTFIVYLIQWIFPILFILGFLVGIATIPVYLWGRRKKNTKLLREKIN